MTEQSHNGVVLFGAGGHAGMVLDTIESAGLPQPVVIVDNNPALAGTTVYGIPVAGADDCLEQAILDHQLTGFVMGIGSVGSSLIRQSVYRTAVARLRNAMTVVHPSSVISDHATLHTGCQIFPAAIINRGATIGENVIVNSGAIVEHDCQIESHVHIAPGATLAGSVTVGTGSHIGCGATVIQSVSIGRNAIVGAGAVVTTDVADNSVVVGVPARILQRQDAA